MNTTAYLSGYRILESVYTGSRTFVYRGIRESDRQPVVIKGLQASFPSFNELVRFRNQYTIAKNLDLPNIIKSLALEPYENSYALVMEDFGGVSLRQYAQTHPLSLEHILAIALQLADILLGLCQHRVVHKDINPANILIHPDTQQVKLIDFSIASLLPKETQEIQNPNVLEGTLAYLAPEQTGRMNRGIDYRADFYGLGVTLYELLTGQLPFQSHDPMALVHCHIAQPPQPPHQVDPTIPPQVSAIVLKLMAKNAEDRYQSAVGLKYDLGRCLSQWRETSAIAEFELGRRDVRDRFLIPEKLYGRDQDVQALLDAFERVSGQPDDDPNSKLLSGAKRSLSEAMPDKAIAPRAINPKSELMLVAGFSGVGKTAVVNEVHKPITRQHGYFIKGKFDQFNRTIPFSAFVQAFRSLMGQLLGESDANLADWKAKILAALEESGQVLVDVIPELVQIIGPQPAVPKLSGAAGQNRFNRLFGKFIRVFATPEHPLVIFLDDLQWADWASLTLLKLLMDESETGYLLVLGAYRDNEVFPAHPLMLTLDDIQKQGAGVATLTLAPLSQADITCLTADTVRCSTEIAAPLARLVYQKTRGNPFFTTQFLQGLHEDGWITFDAAAGYWQCNLTQVGQLALTNDVVEFMVTRLRKLPEATQDILKLAACIGNRFDLATLAVVCEGGQDTAANDLWQALREGFVIPENETYKFFQGQGDRGDVKGGDAVTVAYRFLHDRVQQAAYALIPDDQTQTTHYHIGQLLLQQISPAAREERIFELIGQLNYGTAFITDQSERDDLAQLNLIACRKAKSATAYQAGREYARTGVSLLGEQAWLRQYEMTLALYDLAAELAYLCGDFEQMEHFIDRVAEQAHALSDKVNGYQIRIQSKVSQNQAPEAVIIAQQLLQQFGAVLPESPTSTDIQQAIQAIDDLIGDREIQDLVHLPVMTDPEKIGIVQIASSVIPAAIISGSPLCPLLAALAVNQSIQYGNTPDSPYAYSFYGIILCDILHAVETATQFGQLALQVVSTLDTKTTKPEVLDLLAGFIVHRQSAIQDTLPLLQEGYGAALEVGNLEFAGYHAHKYCLHAFLCGRPLSTLEQETRAYCHGLMQLNQLTTANFCRIYWQPILNLLGATDQPCLLAGDALQEAEFLPQLLSAHDLFGLYVFHLYKFILCYLFGQIDQAQIHAVESREYFKVDAGFVTKPSFYFYDSLVALAQLTAQAEETEETAAAWRRVEDNQTQLQQNWAHHAPMNHQHKADLVEAERCRILGHKVNAIELYDKAIAGAKEHEYLQEEALANELAARFYLDWGKEKIAAVYMQEAYYGYARWGAKAKTDDLEKRYPSLLQKILQETAQTLNPIDTLAKILDSTLSIHSSTKNSRSSSTTINTALDLAALLKASQALSRTILLDDLLGQLSQIILQNSGGDRCALLLPDEDGVWWVRATAAPETIELDATPLEGDRTLPIKLIQYVKNSQEIVMVDDLDTDLSVIDEYLSQHAPKSLLCLPLLNQGQVLGILYLENRATRGVFTRDRLLILNFLCVEAAISLENARLYSNLRQSEQRFRTIFETEPECVKILSADCTILDMNPAGLAMVEADTPSQVIGQQAASCVIPEYRQAYTTLVQQVSQGETGQLEFRLQGLKGTYRWLEIHAAPLRNQHNEIWGVLAVTRDITENKQAEQAVQQLNQQLERQNQDLEVMVTQRTAQLEATLRELESFAYSVSHDLRAPLRHMYGFVSALRRQLGKGDALKDPKAVHYLEVIEESNQKMGQLIDGLLKLSRIGRQELLLKSVDLQPLVEEVINALKPDAETQTVEFQVGALPLVKGDAALLQQVFTNLLGNAVKFSRNRTPAKIEIGVHSDDTFFVKDNGVGFSMDYADQLFGAFQRLHSRREFEGTGIGLSIVQRIIHRHGGAIWADSAPDQGAAFYFTLKPASLH